MSDLPATVHDIKGFLSGPEAELLYRLASEVKTDGHIVEIGSFQGRSTVCLGLGAKQAGAKVWAIDPHEDTFVNDSTHYGMENHAALLKNLVDFDVANIVRVITLPSMKVIHGWHKPVQLLWIDGSHDYVDVFADLACWAGYVYGKIALHDASGHWPGVTRALDEFVAGSKWKIIEEIDATKVLELNHV